MGFVRLLPRSSSRKSPTEIENEVEVDVSETEPEPLVDLPTLDELTPDEPPPLVVSAPVAVPVAPMPGATGTRVIAFANQKGGVARRPRPSTSESPSRRWVIASC